MLDLEMGKGFKTRVASWVVLPLVVLVTACTSVPELRHPTGQTRQPVPGNQEAAARFDALRQGLPIPAIPTVLAHDADDVLALTAQLAQLKKQLAATNDRVPLEASKAVVGRRPRTQAQPISKAPEALTPISTAQAQPNAESPTPIGATPFWIAPAKRFEVSTKDSSLLGVLVRWAETKDWRVNLNGVALRPGAFPAHPVAYADITLAPTAKGLGDDEIETAIGALLQAHEHHKERLALTIVLKSGLQEIDITSEIASAPLPTKTP